MPQTPPPPLRVAFAGTPEFALASLRALAASRHEIVGVLTRPDRPAGRGRQLSASPVKQEAVKCGWPLAQPVTLKTESSRAELTAWRPDVLVVVAYGLILPQSVLDIPRLGGVNVHASLLPRWRGAAPIQRAILAGDAETGITIMQLDAGLDTGPMLLQRSIPIGAETTAGELQATLAACGAEALIETLDGVARGTIAPRAQPDQGATYAPKIEKSEARIDWRGSALAIARAVRAFNPAPIAHAQLDGESVRIFEAGFSAEGSNAPHEPGAVLGLAPEGLRVACGEGVLAIRTLQRAGRNRVSAREFANAIALTGRRFE